MPPYLDLWLPQPTLSVVHVRQSSATPQRLWEAAVAVRLCDVGLLGRLVRWRIPGMPAEIPFQEMFQRQPFTRLDAAEHMLVCGLVGRIWTLRRDYPKLSGPEEFRSWSQSGTARVLFANWVQTTGSGGASLHSESRVQAIGVQGRIGLAAVRPLVRSFQHLVGTEGIEAAVRAAEQN